MANIVVIGETCKDVFIRGRCSRLCPEAPVPVLNPFSVETSEGMAGNTAQNLRSLEPANKVTLVSQKKHISKTRYVDEQSGYILLRVDENDKAERFGADEYEKYYDDIFKSADAIVISDYNKGFLAKEDIQRIALLADEADIPVFLDTKKILGNWSKLITYVKINDKEYKEQLAASPYPQGLCRNLIVTKGPKGATLYNSNTESFLEVPTRQVNVRDVSGAGDTFLAALVTEYLRSGDIPDAISYANAAAAIAVSKQGVVTVKKEEVLV